ncbi:centriolin-like isoform X1 [Styela clava]
MRKSQSSHSRIPSADDAAVPKLPPSITPRASSVPGSRIPSPTRSKVAPKPRSRASTPQRSRSSSISPIRASMTSPQISPIRTSYASQDLSASDGQGSGRNLVRYITHDMIKRLSKNNDQLDQVRSLNFTLSGEKKIRYIENLEDCRNLTSLNFSGNVIQRIEKIDHLTKLRELNLANNQINKIEGLETLTSLQSLNLNGNMIETIPIWFVKKLRAMRILRIGHNQISSLSEIVKLRNFHDLQSLTIAGNPLCDLAHHRSYTVFHLRTVDQLDGQNVTVNERSAANTRFAQDEIDRLARELNKTSEEFKALQDQHNESLENLDALNARERELTDRDQINNETREELEVELDAKDELLKKKAKELQRSQAKQYQLEQELAFYKLDAKFEPLNFPRTLSDEEEDDADSPYIGKSPFKKNQFAVEGRVPGRKGGAAALDASLQEKERLLEEAANRLAQLQRELTDTQKQIEDANREMSRLERDNMERSMSEDEKQKLRKRLAAKIQKVCKLKESAEELEEQLQKDRAELRKSRQELDKMKAKLKKMDPNSPEYARLRAQMIDKEKQIDDLNRRIKENETQLNRLIKGIAVDTETIKLLEEQLAKGTMTADDGLKGELEDIVGGLQDYILNVRQKANAQQTEFDNLLRDRDRLARKLQAIEREKSQLEEDVDDYSQLQQQVSVLGELNDLLQATQDLTESMMRGGTKPKTPTETVALDPISALNTLKTLNDSLNEMREINDALQREASELSVHDQALQSQLEDAEKQVDKLSRSLRDVQGQGKTDRDQLDKQMETTARLQNVVGDKEAEVSGLRKELKKARAANEKLGHDLANRSAQYNEAIGSLVQPEDVARRIAQLKDALRRGDRSTMTPDSDMDEVGKALVDLQKILMDMLGREAEEREAAEKRLNDLERHMAKLKAKLLEAQKEYKETMEAATNAKLEAEKNKHKQNMERLEDEIDQLKNKLRMAEDEVDKAREKAGDEVERLREEFGERSERAKLRDARTQQDLRDLERELGNTKRLLKDKDSSTMKQLNDNEDEIARLHAKLKKLQDDRLRDSRAAADADAAALRAKRDLQNADDEIKALRDLLRAQEFKDSHLDRDTLRGLRDTLTTKQDEVDRLRRMLSGLKDDSAEEIANLLNEIDALRRALAGHNNQIRGLVPVGGYYQFVPYSGGGDPGGKWVYITPGSSRRSPLKRSYVEPPPGPPTGFIVEGATQAPVLTPGTPGMITMGEDGIPMLVPLEGYFCNVPEHHHLEDDIAELQDALAKCRKKKKACKKELEESFQIQDLEEKKIQLDAEISEQEATLTKLRDDEERISKEKIEVSNELAGLKSELARRLKRKNLLEGEVNTLLGEMQMEHSLAQHDDLSEELEEMERDLQRKRTELKEAEKRLHIAKHEEKEATKKAEIMQKRFEDSQVKLNDSEQDSIELERRARDIGVQLVRAHKELRQLQMQTKNAESQRIQLEDDCQQLTRLITNKEAEFTALEQKTENMTMNLERLQSELLLAEEKQTERLSTLRESEKILVERRDELNKIKEQISIQREEIEALDRLIGKRGTEAQLLQENIEQQQNELATVLREGQTDVQEKQKLIKQLKQQCEEFSNQRAELEIQVSSRKEEITKLREMNDKSTEELQNKISEISKHKSELKHVLEMLKLEHQDLESLRQQHETKLTELDKTQRHLLDERSELDRLQMETQRRTAEVERNKQMVDKYRSDVDHLTTERSTLEDTVNSLTKEKEYLSEQCGHLEEKFQTTKQAVLEARLGIDKSKATLDQLERDVVQERKEVKEANKEKTMLTKEVAHLRNTARDIKSELVSSQTELDELQQHMQTLEEELRASTKKRDEILLEVTGLREDAKHRSHQVESLSHDVARKQDEIEKLTRESNEKQMKLEERERELSNLIREVEREEERLSRIITQLNNEIERMKKDLAEKKDQLESAVMQRDAVKRDMDRLGHVDQNFKEVESKVAECQSQISTLEDELAEVERDRAEVKGQLSAARGEIEALNIENEHERNKLAQKIDDLQQELGRTKTRDAAEIASLEQTAQDHCNRATRLANELNNLREEFINAKKIFRSQEEETEKQQLALERTLSNLKSELRSEVIQDETGDIENSRSHADEMNKLYDERETNQRKMHTLREIQRSCSPPAKAPVSILRKTSAPRVRHVDNNTSSMQSLREQLAAQQEEIASQIRRQMSRHREAWEERKKQSEGKLESLRRKVDNLDELVSNTSMNSLSRTRDQPLDESLPGRRTPTFRDNNILPERDF